MEDPLFMTHPEIAGMRTAQLPSGWTISSRGGDDIRTGKYEFSEDGYLSKMDVEDEDGGVNTITLTWE
jgi:hypothetical protein